MKRFGKSCIAVLLAISVMGSLMSCSLLDGKETERKIEEEKSSTAFGFPAENVVRFNKEVSENDTSSSGEPSERLQEDSGITQMDEYFEDKIQESLIDESELSAEGEPKDEETSIVYQAEECDHNWIAITQTVSHPAEYTTVHHEAKTHTEGQYVRGEETPSIVIWDEVLERDVGAIFGDGKQIHHSWTYYVNPNVYDRWWVGITDENGYTTYTYYDQTEQPAKPEGCDEWICLGACSVSEYQRGSDTAITGDEAVGYYAMWSGLSWGTYADYHYISHITYLDEGGRTEDVEINEIGRNPYTEDGMRIATNCHPDGEEYVYTSSVPLHYETVTIVDEEAWDEEVLVREAWDEEVVICYECSKCSERRNP